MKAESSGGAASEQLRAEHRLIENEIDQLERAVKQPAADLMVELGRCLRAIQDLSRIHFAKEETVLYPYLRSMWPELLAELDEQHAYTREVETHLAEVAHQGNAHPDPRQAAELVRFALELSDVIQHHIVAEEDELLRLADERLTPEEQRTLAERMLRLQPDTAA